MTERADERGARSGDGTATVGGDGRERTVVVGIDGSPGSAKALLWAAARPELGRIQPVTVWHLPWWIVGGAAPGSPPVPSDAAFSEMARVEAQRQLESLGPHGALPLIVARGRTGRTLVAVGDRSDLMVVGCRGRNAAADTFLGSVSGYCIRHASVPVVIVPEHAAPEAEHGRVVVGVDGSRQSVEALRWALASTSDATTVEVVGAWNSAPTALPEVERAAATRRRALIAGEVDAALSAVAELDSTLFDGRSVVPRVVEGDPRIVLSEAAASADLLVVGAIGHGRVARLLVGSVASALAHRPVTTTVVVPPPTRPSDDLTETGESVGGAATEAQMA